MTAPRTALVVAYYFPPSGGPGVQRTLKTVKYLREFGWNPVVLTVRDADYPARDESLLDEIPDDVTVVRTFIPEPYTVYRALTGKKPGAAVDVNVNNTDSSGGGVGERFAQWVRAMLFVPDARVGWLATGTRAGVEAARAHRAQVVYSSSPPYTCALLGRRIARRVGVPWVAEFRDPWSGFLSAPRRPWPAAGFERRLERGVIRDADRLVVAWQGIAADFEAKYPGVAENRVRLIPNGYDPADLEAGDTPQHSRFTVVYTGSMYGVRNPDTVLQAAARLREAGVLNPERCRFRFIGRFGDDVRAMFRRPEVADMVEEVSYLPHAQSVAEARGAHALLLVVDDYPGAEGIVPGKVYEYIGVRRPILALAPEGAVASLVRETGAGRVLGQHDVAGTADAIGDLYREWIETGTTRFPGRDEAVARLSRRARTRELAAVFDEVTS